MAFKNLHNHNLALVAKQGWRMLSRPQSSTARILEAKYNPTLIDAKIGANQSYICRSFHGDSSINKGGFKEAYWFSEINRDLD